ncbi:uncharacterized protein N7477_006850 [Penicillium maclennaniae]|uniref:uncharacterized protein n=1 Tax=Penicillium maclennaniae TaxID=1343394 RepID=UPI00254042C5|nr:uncharacterized protein N7477_006850 [Penicillium maclennaniae]KAJ5668280.1 hypothetical protein N7477_006850 [Penicillium maclennaniae]
MAPSRTSTTKIVPSKDQGQIRRGVVHEKRSDSVSEAASQDDDDISVISGQYDRNSDIEDIPRSQSRPTAPVTQRAPPARGIQFDHLKPTTSMIRTAPSGQELHDEVQWRGMEPIQPVQSPEKPENTSLRLRLDLNLDIEVELKASIRGDLTLSLL